MDLGQYECDGQFSLFDYEDGFSVKEKHPMRIDKPIRLIETFAGIGSQAMALRDLGVEFTHHRVIEFDQKAMASYNAIHGTNFEPSDIQTVKGEDLGITEKEKFCYILTYSFPCQDLSLAGRMKGMEKGSNTRSGLLWEVERILTECKEYNGNLPDLLLMENVSQVHGKGNLEHFGQWLKFLESLGYQNLWFDLNAKEIGIPQNRKRCFCVSWLDKDATFTPPETIPLDAIMADYLETEVEEKYYINSERAQKLIDKLVDDNPEIVNEVLKKN